MTDFLTQREQAKRDAIRAFTAAIQTPRAQRITPPQSHLATFIRLLDEHRTDTPPTRITIPTKKFDPTAPCARHDCDKPIGEYKGGKYPIHCEEHRHTNHRYKAPGMRRTRT